MTRDISFTALYEVVEDGWVQARVRELPEVITVAPTKEQAREFLLDAVSEYLRSLGGNGAKEFEGNLMAEEPLEISLSA
jgi:predicted RNase H-like HicB family nuclease